MLNRLHKDNRGLTLVELLVGVTILGVIVAPLLHIFITGTKTATTSRLYGEATVAAQNLTEQLQALGVETLLSNAQSLTSDAYFYTLDGSGYTKFEDPDNDLNGRSAPSAPDSLPRAYYLGIKPYAAGTSAFDALITLELPNDPDNSEAVVIADQVETVLDMRPADEKALLELKAQCAPLMPDVTGLTLENVTRAITLNVVKTVGTAADSYRIEAIFDYSGSIPLGDNKFHSFTDSEQDVTVAPLVPRRTDGKPVLSASLFYNAYYKTEMTSEKLIINNDILNPSRSDINLFIVNASSLEAPVGSNLLIWYKYQAFDADDEPVNRLIYTNLDPDDVTYHAWKNPLYRRTIPVTGYLAQTEARNRKYKVNIQLFQAGTGFSGTPLLSLDSTKLSY